MVKEINTTVVEEYERYVKIQMAAKTLAEEHICLHQDERRQNQQCGDVKVAFQDDAEDARLNISLNAEKLKSFKFRLFCDQFMQEPCYRFDSDGPFHRNPDQPGVILVQRQVAPPHFHKFDEKGRVVAYKTDRLVAEELNLLSDYQAAMRHFCDEEHVEVSPATTVHMDHLPLGVKEFTDPLEGVEFP